MPSSTGEFFMPGKTMNCYTGNDWVFQGSTSSDPFYEGNFEADINAIAESTGDDSGYFSNDADSTEASNAYLTICDTPLHPSPLSNIGSKRSLSCDIFYANVDASDKSNRGTISTGTLNKSTTHLEKGTSFSKQRKETRISKTLNHHNLEYEPKAHHMYSNIENSGPHPLDQWIESHERHESIAYRLWRPADLQSSKRRKTSEKKGRIE